MREKGNALSDTAKRQKATPRKHKQVVRETLSSLAGLVKEAGIVYRLMRADRLDHDKGRSLVWVLSQIRAMLEAQHLERIEAKLNQLQATAESRGMIANGHNGADQQARTPALTSWRHA